MKPAWLLLPMLCPVLLAIPTTVVSAPAKPNVILILADDQGSVDAGCYGASDLYTLHTDALAAAFKCGVNDVPLWMVLSWFEQKAVAILLTLLHLGWAPPSSGFSQGVSPQQFVFTIPKRLRIYFRFERRLLGELGRGAARTVTEAC
jgi:hypothetical protein